MPQTAIGTFVQESKLKKLNSSIVFINSRPNNCFPTQLEQVFMSRQIIYI